MSRHTVTIRHAGRIDHDAIIGYDPPLLTFFVQAFPHPETDDPALWLGNAPFAFPTLSALLGAMASAGYELDDLTEATIASMQVEIIAADHDLFHGLADP